MNFTKRKPGRVLVDPVLTSTPWLSRLRRPGLRRAVLSSVLSGTFCPSYFRFRRAILVCIRRGAQRRPTGPYLLSDVRSPRWRVTALTGKKRAYYTVAVMCRCLSSAIVTCYMHYNFRTILCNLCLAFVSQSVCFSVCVCLIPTK